MEEYCEHTEVVVCTCPHGEGWQGVISAGYVAETRLNCPAHGVEERARQSERRKRPATDEPRLFVPYNKRNTK